MARNNRSRGGGAGNARGGNQNPPPQRRPQRPPPPLETQIRVKFVGFPKPPSAFAAQQELIQTLRTEITEIFTEIGYRPLSVYINLASGSADVAFRNKGERDRVIQVWEQNKASKVLLQNVWYPVLMEPREGLNLLSRIKRVLTTALVLYKPPTSTNAGEDMSDHKPADSGAHKDPKEAKDGAAGATGDAHAKDKKETKTESKPDDKGKESAGPRPTDSEAAEEAWETEWRKAHGPRPKNWFKALIWDAKMEWAEFTHHPIRSVRNDILEIGFWDIVLMAPRTLLKRYKTDPSKIPEDWRKIVGKDNSDEIAIILSYLYTDQAVEWAEWLELYFGPAQRDKIGERLVNIAFRDAEDLPRLGGERTREISPLEYAVWIVQRLLDIPNRAQRARTAINTYRLCPATEEEAQHKPMKSFWQKVQEKVPRWAAKFGRSTTNVLRWLTPHLRRGLRSARGTFRQSVNTASRHSYHAHRRMTDTPYKRFIQRLYGGYVEPAEPNPNSFITRIRASMADWIRPGE